MSNLPPGVSEHMIPGNRPEDMAEEEFWDVFGKKLDEAKIVAISDLPAAPSANSVSVDDLWDNAEFVKLVQIARDLGYQRGFNEGVAEAQMEEAMKHTDD